MVEGLFPLRLAGLVLAGGGELMMNACDGSQISMFRLRPGIVMRAHLACPEHSPPCIRIFLEIEKTGTIVDRSWAHSHSTSVVCRS